MPFLSYLSRFVSSQLYRGYLIVSIILILSAAGEIAQAQHRVLDFTFDAAGNPIGAGDFIAEQYAAWGVHISESDPNHRAMAFDTANPTGGDSDIGAPNQAFNATGGELWDGSSPRGPGVGSGGADGQPGENRWPLGNALILSTDNNQSVPNDHSGGGIVTFVFDHASGVTINEVWVLDDLEGGDFIRACDITGTECFLTEIDNPFENSFQQIAVNAVLVETLFVELSGSGAIPSIRFTGPELNLDWGDAPDPQRGYGSGDYYTLGQDDGPNHIIDGTTFLGSVVDADPDGQPNASATGDDGDGSDDEDGVIFTTPLNPGQVAGVTITASVAGILNAWVDFNGDGLFTGPNEHVFDNEALAAGPNNLTFPVPNDATLGLVYNRFRFSSAEDLPPTGPAPDGEVEDYLVEILVPVELSSFSANLLEDAVELAWVTQSEEENLGYEILRSESGTDARIRITEELIPGAGNSLVEQRYTYLDESIERGGIYIYTLVDISYDGAETHHGPITVSVPFAAYELVLEGPVPSPVRETGIIHYSIPTAGTVRMVLYDYTGRERRVLADEYMPSGSGTVSIDRIDGRTGGRLSAGAYILRFDTNAGSRTQRIIIAE